MEKERLVSLVTRAQSGDGEAMNDLFGAFYNDVYYFALKTVKSDEIAADVTQEAFVEILQTIGELREPAAFVTWMKQITYHQCTRYFKKKKDVLVEEDEEGNSLFDTIPEEKGEFIPDEALEKSEFKKTVLSLLDDLSEEQRSAVMMYYFDEMSVKDIARIQGVSEGTVKSRLNYARKAIRLGVEDYEKKTGTKLYAIPFLPLLRWALEGSMEKAMPLAVAKNVAAGVSAATGVSLSVTSAAATATAAAAGAAVGVGLKAAAIPLGLKIAAGVTAAAILFGGGTAAILSAREDEKEPMTENETLETEEKAVLAEPETKKDENEEENETFEGEELVLEGIIPAGCTYVTAEGVTLSEGENFPETCLAGDRVYYEDYVYVYEGIWMGRDTGEDAFHLWKDGFDDGDSGLTEEDVFGAFTPSCLDGTKKEYSPIAARINGKPIRALYATFNGCVNMEVAPVIPSTVTSVAGAFYGCTSLVTAPILPEGVSRFTGAFYGCTSLTGDVFIHGVLDRTTSFYGDVVFRETVLAINLTGKAPVEDLHLIATNSENPLITVNGNPIITDPPFTPPQEEETEGDFTVPEGMVYHSVKGNTAVGGEKVTLQRGDRLEDEDYAYYYAAVYSFDPETGEISLRDDFNPEGEFFPMVLDRTKTYYAPLREDPSLKITCLFDTYKGCVNMTEAPKVPEGIVNMEGAFWGCTSLLETPYLPDSVSNVFNTFSGCTSLTAVKNFPPNLLTAIQTFQGCTALVTIPASLPATLLDADNMFLDCQSLVTGPETIPASVLHATGMFSGCAALSKAPEFEGSLENMDVMFYGCVSLRQMPAIPEGVKSMQSTFSGCMNLISSTTLPDGLLDMSCTFSGCASLRNAPYIPPTVTTLYMTFMDCTSLRSAPKIHSGVQDMRFTFSGCTSLQGTVTVYSTKLSEAMVERCFEGTTLSITLAGVEASVNLLKPTGEGNISIGNIL